MDTLTAGTELELFIRARYPLIYILTHEEERASKIIDQVAAAQKKKVFTWSATDPDGKPLPGGKTSPLKFMDAFLNSPENGILVLRDFHEMLDDSTVVRKCRDAVISMSRSFKTIMIVSPVLKVPAELEKDVTIIDLDLPNSAELGAILDRVLEFGRKNARLNVNISDDERVKIIDASLGLTEQEAYRIYSKSLLTENMFDAKDIPRILTEKKQLIRKSGILEYFDTDETLDSVGGMAGLKSWLARRKEAFTPHARDYGLPQPRGILLLGVQGCGKSLASKSVAALFNQPLLRLDIGRVFNSFMGASEQNMRRAIATAESLAPVVLWIDEIEKGFSGTKSSGVTDAGTTSRIFATFLTWMQERTKPVFVIATANSIRDLPPELLRKGRFDEIFFIDLPDQASRKQIFSIHLAKRKRHPQKFDLENLALASDGYSGSEIEQAVVDAMYAGFAQNREFASTDIISAIKQTVPLSVTMREDIDRLREWAKTRARPAAGA